MVVDRGTLPLSTPLFRAERLRGKIVLWQQGVLLMIYE
jgi:hypothetical protein